MKKSTRSSTAREIFVDTSGFFALLVAKDPMHARAAEVLDGARRAKHRFVTTDYVLDETATLLRARGAGHLVAGLFDAVFASNACRIVWMDADRFEVCRAFFLEHRDKDWSFTDCVSFCVMRELGLRRALTTDRHFAQARFEPLLVEDA
jgi:predicted nucleic acid-binding protein